MSNFQQYLCISILVSNFGTITPKKHAFEVAYQWTYINYTWQNPQQYQNALSSGIFNPVNIAISGIKIYQDNVYIASPTTLRQGVPVTLGYFPENSSQTNPIIRPFPNWETGSSLNGNSNNCDLQQSVSSMEIDPEGIMWVLDGTRPVPANCASKLTSYNLKTRQKLHIFSFPDEISSRTYGFLDDLVLDDDFIYISDTSFVDPGLIVYSKSQNNARKFRDASMFPVENLPNFSVDGYQANLLSGINGIALSPKSARVKRVYYCVLTGFNLYSIETSILKNESLYESGEWRNSVQFVGKKKSETDPLTIDNEGNMYYGLLTLYSVVKWNTEKKFKTGKIIDTNRELMTWTDSLTYDNRGNLFMLASNIQKYLVPEYKPQIDSTVKFRILKMYTGTKSYLY